VFGVFDLTIKVKVAVSELLIAIEKGAVNGVALV